MIKVIIDCNYKYSEMLKKYIKQMSGVEITNYEDLNSDFILIKEIENEKDLKMLKDLKKISYKFNVISLISTEKFVLDLLDLQIMYFMKKDKLKENLFIINECIKNFVNSKSSYIDIISNYEHIMINVKSIIYLESYGHDVIINTITGKFKCRKKLSLFLNELRNYNFTQIHKSYVINKKYINCIKSKAVVMSDFSILPIGKKFQNNIKSDR